MSNPLSALGAGASVIGGISGNKAAKSAAKAQQQSADAATAETRRQYDQNRTDLAPGRALYTGASNKLSNLLGLDTGAGDTPGTAAFTPLSYNEWAAGQGHGSNGINLGALNNAGYSLNNQFMGNMGNNAPQQDYQSYLNSNPARAATAGTKAVHDSSFGSLLNPFTQNDLESDPVYQNGFKWGLDRGSNAIDAHARASGSMDSGNTLKELTQFGNDYGSTKANDSFNRFNTTKNQNYNFLSGAAGIGQNSANSTVLAGQNASNNVSNNMLGAGNARSAGIVGGNNSFQSMLSNLTKQFSSSGGGSGNSGNPGNYYGIKF